jgi:secreted PhoX family phosphatase
LDVAKNMVIDRRGFVTLSAGALLTASCGKSSQPTPDNGTHSTMLVPIRESGFTIDVLATIGEQITSYRPPGIMDGMGAWSWDENTVRLFVNHELPPSSGYPWKLQNQTELTGARISWFDIDSKTRKIRAAGNAINEIRDRQANVVTSPVQIHEHRYRFFNRGLNNLCSAKGFTKGEAGFVDDLLFTHEEVSAREDHPHGGSIWTLDVRAGTLWALPALGRGSWENVTSISMPDQDQPDGHIGLLLSDDNQFGGAPLYFWIGKKNPEGDLPARNGLRAGQLHVWVSGNGDRDPDDWHGTGSARTGHFVTLEPRDKKNAGKNGYDPDGYLDDITLRQRAAELGAFMLSRPEDLHTNPANGMQVVLCSTGHGIKYPADDWGTVYLIDVTLEGESEPYKPAATIQILHDCDDFGDFGIRSADNVVWASDGMIYIHEDKSTKHGDFGGESKREASTWRIDPENPEDYQLIAVVDRAAVLPADAQDKYPNKLGQWECCGLIDVSALFNAAPNELLMITAVQAHSIRGGSLGGKSDLVQGGQLLMLARKSSD